MDAQGLLLVGVKFLGEMLEPQRLGRIASWTIMGYVYQTKDGMKNLERGALRTWEEPARWSSFGSFSELKSQICGSPVTT